ncbi:MAG: energy transducer TonB [Acidobacteriota bacterium]
MFEHSLIDLAATKRPRRRLLSLPAAILLHGAAFGVFMISSYWQVEAVPAPPINDVFVVNLPPPLPPLGSGRPETKTETKPATVKPADVRTPQPTVQPEQVADLVPAPSTSPVVSDITGLPPGGDPRGSKDGIEGGDPEFGVDHVPAAPVVPVVAPPPPPVNDAPIQVGGAVMKPEVVFRTEPRYTELARKARVEGVVVIRAIIDERGNVTDVQLLRGQPMGLDQAAMEAVRTWRFKPATLHGNPVKVYFNLTVNFTLQR